jgi:hypothetical protein
MQDISKGKILFAKMVSKGQQRHLLEKYKTWVVTAIWLKYRSVYCVF